MTDLSPKARALIDASRQVLRATHGDRERIEATLRARLGADALPPETSPPATTTSGTSWPIASGVAVGVCVLGAVCYLALRPSASAPAPRSERAPLVSRPASSPPTAADEPPTATTAASKPPTAPSPVARDRLGKEVALLSRATSELRAGNAAAALRVLDEHERKFPSGKLSEERRGAKAQALCLLGRVSAGRAELSHLAPGSPAAARAEQVCK